MAKRGELNWLATQSTVQLRVPLSPVDTSGVATGQSVKDLNRPAGQAHSEASDKLDHPCLVGSSVRLNFFERDELKERAQKKQQGWRRRGSRVFARPDDDSALLMDYRTICLLFASLCCLPPGAVSSCNQNLAR